MKKFFDNHIIMSGIYKGISGMSLFLSIRLLIDYLGNNIYGIWVLLFTVFQLVLLMDFGIQSSLKTKIPVFFHEKRIDKVSVFISSTYKFSVFISLIIFLFFLILTKTINLKLSFNISELSKDEVNYLLLINIIFFCLTFVANIHKSLYVAFLKGKYAEQSIAVNQLLFLISIFFLVIFSNQNLSNFTKLILISFINGSISLFVNILYTIHFFKTESVKVFLLNTKENSFFNDIFKLGLKFMIIQIGFLFIFSSDNYIISNAFNPGEVVAYEVVNKLFLFPYMILFAALTPLWSLFAKHYLEQNKTKLLNNFKKFNQFFVIILLGLISLTFITPFVVSIWIKEPITLPNNLVFFTAILTGLKIYVNFYILFLSGLGKLNFYISILIISILLKIPLSYFFVDLGFGINSVLISSLIIIFFWTLLIPFKSYKIVKSINI